MGRARPARGLDLRPRHGPQCGPCRPRPTIRLGRARYGPCQKLCALGRPIRHSTNVHLYPHRMSQNWLGDRRLPGPRTRPPIKPTGHPGTLLIDPDAVRCRNSHHQVKKWTAERCRSSASPAMPF
jgi:hypothetical protein